MQSNQNQSSVTGAGTALRVETKPMLHAEHLEQLIDCYGLPRLLSELSSIAYAKAEHVHVNWQDKQLAQAWTHTGDKLSHLGHNLPRL